MSLVLVVGALLFARSFQNLVSEPLGFDRGGVLVVDAGLPPPAPSPEAALALRRELAGALRAIPGVRAIAETNVVPLSGNSYQQHRVARRLDAARRGRTRSSAASRPATSTALGMRLIAGREIADSDTGEAPKVAVVNETFARAFARGASPIGQRFWIEATPTRPETLYEIVGLVGDAKYRRVREDASPVVFIALAQHGAPGAGGTWLVRASVPPQSLVPAARAALSRVDGRLRFVFRTLDAEIADTLLRDRAMAMLSALFGLLAATAGRRRPPRCRGLHGRAPPARDRDPPRAGRDPAAGSRRRSCAKAACSWRPA